MLCLLDATNKSLSFFGLIVTQIEGVMSICLLVYGDRLRIPFQNLIKRKKKKILHFALRSWWSMFCVFVELIKKRVKMRLLVYINFLNLKYRSSKLDLKCSYYQLSVIIDTKFWINNKSWERICLSMECTVREVDIIEIVIVNSEELSGWNLVKQ